MFYFNYPINFLVVLLSWDQKPANDFRFHVNSRRRMEFTNYNTEREWLGMGLIQAQKANVLGSEINK